MKTYRPMIFLLGLFLTLNSYGQSQELQQLLLNIEKLTQLKSILSNMKTGYQIYQQGYGLVSSLAKGNFDLHSTYLNGLLSASPTVRKYRRVAEILAMQAQLAGQYKRYSRQFSQSHLFSMAEQAYFNTVYSRLLGDSLQDLDQLVQVLTANTLRMSDAERIAAIDRIHDHAADKLQFLRFFNRQGVLLAFQRGREVSETRSLQELYDLNN